MRLSIFRKRPDPKRKLTALRINYTQNIFSLLRKNFMLYGIKTDRMTQTKLNEANKKWAFNLQDKTNRYSLRAPSL